MRIIYDRNKPISKGMAYVEFKDKASIPKALELTGETLGKVMVKHSEAEKNIAWEAGRLRKASPVKNEVTMHRNRVDRVHFLLPVYMKD